MDKIDWTSFTRRIAYNVDSSTLFQHWVIQSNIEKWFLKNAHFFRDGEMIAKDQVIQKGDTYKWSWHGSDNVAEGEILDIINDSQIKFTFLGCDVSVTIKKEMDVNIIELVQSKIGVDEETKKNIYVECTRGWTFYMTNLKSILEGGVDLRNKNYKLKNVINT